ncbi:MAG: protein kinase [Gemmatimonadales bacterium]
MPDRPDQLKTALSGRYYLKRQLGEGGMATVYLATDLKHKRQVAIKVLKPELAQAIGPQRFLREIEIAASLSHPHILPLYDSGEAGGNLYYVMPFVEGESLAARMKRQGQLPVDEALQITVEVADALSYAHSRGVIHRDIKPDNIMFQAGHAVVADFGIARVVDAAGGDRITQTGTAIGTPAYMSPEQCMGSTEIDARTDIYAIGSVLYEMLAGEPPYVGPTAQAIIAKRLSEPIPRVTTLRDTVPPHVAQAIGTALAKAPADRFMTAARFVDQLTQPSSTDPTALIPGDAPRSEDRTRLRPAALLSVIGVLSVLVAWLVFMRDPSPATGVLANSIAVLPFENSSGDPELEYFSDGVAEEILSELSRTEGLTVISRTSAWEYKGSTKSPTEIAAKLRVATIMQGSVRRWGDSVRVVAELIDPQTSRTLWTDTYEGPLTEVFNIRQDIVDNVRTLLVGAGQDSVALVGGAPTGDLEAYQLFLRSRYLAGQSTARSLRQAIDVLDSALARDPGFVEAWAWLARQWANAPAFGIPTGQALAEANLALQQGRAIDPGNEQILLAQAVLDVFFYWRIDHAEAGLRSVLRLNPSSTSAHTYFGIVLTVQGRLADAVTEIERAQELDPLNRTHNADLTFWYILARRYEDALVQYRRSLALDPDFVQFYMIGWALYDATRNDSLVAETVETFNQLAEESTFPPGTVRAAYASQGSRGLYETLLSLIESGQLAPHGGVNMALAAVNVRLGRIEEAVDAVESMVQGRDIWTFMMRDLPTMEPLQGHPRYEAALNRLYVR